MDEYGEATISREHIPRWPGRRVRKVRMFWLPISQQVEIQEKLAGLEEEFDALLQSTF